METILQLFKSGGLVMWPLLGLSIFSVAIIFERSLFWFKLTRGQEKFLQKILTLYQEDSDTAQLLLRRHQNLPIARVFTAALSLRRPTPKKFRLALETAAQAEVPLLKKFSNAFDTIISISPLLGLLGTVLGLITSLASLQIGSVESAQNAGVTTGVTGGISEALTSTATGLIIAIFTLFVANFFRGLYLKQIALIQELSGQLELLHLDKYEQLREKV